MKILATLIIALVAALHGYIAWFEIFAWTTRGPQVFTTLPADLFPQTINMAANQGLYNAFLAAGLLWSLVIRDPKWQRNVAVCFLLFVFVAGAFAAATVAPSSGSGANGALCPWTSPDIPVDPPQHAVKRYAKKPVSSSSS